MANIDAASGRARNDWQISDDQLAYWGEHFLPSSEPFFIQNEDTVHQLLKQGFVILTQAEFYDTYTSFYIDYGFVYNLWEIPYTTYVWMCNANQRAQLSADLLQAIFQEQYILKRGQVYHKDELQYDKLAIEYLSTIEHTQNWCSDGDHSYLLLTSDLWHTYPIEIKNNWIQNWLVEQIKDDPIRIKDIDSISVHPVVKSRIDHYNGSFADQCGANCFAVTLALASSPEHTDSIINLWLHEGPFLRSLQALNYDHVFTMTNTSQIEMIEPLDVLIWSNAENHAIHASFCIAPDYIFTKMGQSWIQPWLVTTMVSIFNYADVIQNGGQIKVYRKEEIMTV